MNPQTNALMSGFQQGDQQAQSMLPNASQPMGRPQPKNILEGTLNRIASDLLAAAHIVGQQGDAYRKEKERLMKLATEVTKTNNSLTDIAQEGSNG
jgi:hypothetical protein